MEEDGRAVWGDTKLSLCPAHPRRTCPQHKLSPKSWPALPATRGTLNRKLQAEAWERQNELWCFDTSELQEGHIIIHPTASLLTAIANRGICWLVTGRASEGLRPGNLWANDEVYYPNIIEINVFARLSLR